MTTTTFGTPTDLTLAGGPVRHYFAGDPARPAVLLLHGGMLDTVGFTWRFVAPALAEDFAVHAIDLPRHGGSRPWSGALTQDRFERILDELLDAQGLDRVALVGLSLGAGVSIGFALDRPDRVSGLVLAAPGGVGARRTAQFPTWLALNTPGLLGAVTRYLARTPESIRKSLTTQLIAAGDQTPAFEELLALAVEEVEAKARHREPALDDWMVRAYGPWRMRLDFTPRLSDRKSVV